MIFRIGVAVAALIWIHGLERTREDISAASANLRDEAPKAALAYCANNAAQCQDVALRAVTGSGLAQAGASLPVATTSLATASLAPAPVATTPARRDAQAEASPLPLPAGAFPLPPRRPRG